MSWNTLYISHFGSDTNKNKEQGQIVCDKADIYNNWCGLRDESQQQWKQPDAYDQIRPSQIKRVLCMMSAQKSTGLKTRTVR